MATLRLGLPRRGQRIGVLRSRRSPISVGILGLFASFLACSRPRERPRDEPDEPPPVKSASAAPIAPTVTPPPTSSSASSDDKPLVYLVSADDVLWSFEPEQPGNLAYRSIGRMHCPSSAQPESMAVDRKGFARVSYGSTEVFRVRLRDAACTPTSGIHSSRFVRMLGMGFTANAPGSTDETLYVLSPDFGLGTVALPSLDLTVLGPVEDGELTGGGDGRLFRFAPQGRLSEIDKATLSQKTIHSFEHLQRGASGYAFARYGGVFYVFTASPGTPSSQTTELDPTTGVEHVRDANIGFRVVGAGQSTRAPIADKGGGMSETFH